MKLAAASVLVLVGIVVPVTAEAAWPAWGWYGWYGAAYAPPTDYVPRPPYYALYPPVYYSPFRTARPYGASPFAWYPGRVLQVAQFAPPTASSPPPQWIENPFVTRKQAASLPEPQTYTTGTSVRLAATPTVAVIENPYFDGSAR